jgi:NADPH-dependent glutamate synthase beta subunit-like oxidoreductase
MSKTEIAPNNSIVESRVPCPDSRFPDLHPALDAHAAVIEANRCLFCYDAPCTAACPTHIDVPRFIERYKTSPDFRVSGRVVVIGGGNTAIDAARRLGAEEVHLFYRRTEREMPAFKSEYNRSKLEGVRFHWLARPSEVIGFEGRAAAVRFVKTRLGAADHSGRSAVIPVPGSQFEFVCDLVIPAIGQTRLAALLENTRGISVKNGRVVDRPTGRTTNPRYFAGGGCINGGREVVDAVADGKRAVVALGLGIAVALLGLVVAPLRFLYDYAWFVGFAVAGGLYLLLMQRSPALEKLPEWEGEI